MVTKHREEAGGSQKERAERTVADATTIDGRKGWICQFCSGISVWTRWRCRRCIFSIAAGKQGKHKKAVLSRIKCGIRDHPPRVVKTGSPVIKKESSRGCLQRWSCSVSSKGWSPETQGEPTRRADVRRQAERKLEGRDARD